MKAQIEANLELKLKTKNCLIIGLELNKLKTSTKKNQIQLLLLSTKDQKRSYQLTQQSNKTINKKESSIFEKTGPQIVYTLLTKSAKQDYKK